MTRMRFSGGIVRTVEKEVTPTDAGGIWELNDVSQRIGSDDYPINEPAPPTTTGRTATGALTDGSMVVLNDDDTVSVVVTDGKTFTESLGDKSVFYPSSSGSDYAVSYDEEQEKILIVARASNAIAIVGTISGDTITLPTMLLFKAER